MNVKEEGLLFSGYFFLQHQMTNEYKWKFIFDSLNIFPSLKSKQDKRRTHVTQATLDALTLARSSYNYMISNHAGQAKDVLPLFFFLFLTVPLGFFPPYTILNYFFPTLLALELTL